MTFTSDLTRRRFAAGAVALAAAPFAVQAQAFPSRPMRIVVGFSPGSPSDLLARGLADQLGAAFKSTVVVDNKPGAGGMLAIRDLLQQPADGHTLLVVSAAHAALPAINANLGFDPVRDIAGVTRIANVPSILVVTPALGISTQAELIASLKSGRQDFNFSSPGIGSANHFAAEYFLAQSKTKAVHVPYKGVPEATTAVVTGECQFAFIPVPNALQLIQGGKLKAISTCTTARAKVLPDVPTVNEAGLTGYEFNPWFGVLTHGKVPAAVRKTLVDASLAGLNTEPIRARFAPIGAEIATLPGERFDAYVQAEIAKYRYIAATASIKVG